MSIRNLRYRKPSAVKSYCDFNRKYWGDKYTGKKPYILMDCFPVPQWIMVNSVMAQLLSKKLGASVASYGYGPRDPETGDIYASFGCTTHLRIKLTRAQRLRHKRHFVSIVEGLETAEQLFDLHIDGVWIGIDIYESILRIGIPTVDPKSYHTRLCIYLGLEYFVFFYDLAEQNGIAAVLPSHDSYIQMGLVAKIAQKFQRPVYYANPFELAKSCRSHDLYEKFNWLPKVFSTFSPEQQAELIDRARNALTKRLGGVVGVDMRYQIKSAFVDDNKPRQTSQSDKPKILVASHCFFDNPHAYGRLTFIDFYKWLEFLGEVSLETDFDWYIKPHRDYLPGTMEVLQDFISTRDNWSLVDPETSFHQLNREGVKLVLTCYGSVGHELPLLGYTVINASFNPHVAYTFNVNVSDVEDYRNKIKAAKDYKEIGEEQKLEMFEFYAVRNYVLKNSNLPFDSFDDYDAFLGGNLLSTDGYAYFLQDAEKFQERLRSRILQFLEADCQYDFELGLSGWDLRPYGFSQKGEVDL